MYHEAVDKEPVPGQMQLARYAEIADNANIDGRQVFRANWRGRVVGSELQQIWRDHLQLLSLLQHESGRWARGRYILVYPAGHTWFEAVAQVYQDEVLAELSTFRDMTIEELLRPGVLHHPELLRRSESGTSDEQD